jgi:uncharacterized protein DUF4112
MRARCGGVTQLAPMPRVTHVTLMQRSTPMSDANNQMFPRSNARRQASRNTNVSGPVIDQEGRTLAPPESIGEGFRDFNFNFNNTGGGLFGNLTREQRFARLEALAKLLDVAFILPGTNIRYGIDGLIGLVPVVGDIITTAISLWLVREARSLGAPWHVTARMLGNVALDGAVGMVPLVGDAFDVMFRANIRNMKLLRRWMEKQPRL